jgi:Na+-translocating ferredoxin:NAD+ oxidoreductase subunit D
MNQSAHATLITSRSSVTLVMFKVMAALLPGIAAYVWYFGPAILVTLAIASLTALFSEALILWLRRVPVRPFVGDLSAVVTAWLLALSMPPLSVWWLTVSATLFAIVIAKHLYGGLGSNPFNPAMAGWAAMLISFPLQMSHWSPPSVLAATRTDFMTELTYIFREFSSRRILIDAETMATPLDTLKTQIGFKQHVADILVMPIYGHFAGHGTEIIALCYLIGGLYLVQQKIITWHMPAAFLGAIALIAVALQIANPLRYASAWFHLFGGASMLGAFFIVTDPVSGATTPKGKLIFAGAAGLLTYLIRVFGGYPDGVAFAVLIMNMCAPLIDARTQPPVFGKRRKEARAGVI